MSQGFNFNFDSLRNNYPADQAEGEKNVSGLKDADYPSQGNTRNVCFVPMDGDPVFLNYGYMIRGKYFREESKIVLTFTSDTVKLIGVHLEPLFYDFMGHVPMQIVCKDARYNAVEENPCVNKIEISKNDD